MGRRLRFTIVTLACTVACAVVLPASVQAAGVEHAKLEILSYEGLAKKSYVFVRGALSADLTRPNGTTGSFKVPVWLVYPTSDARCNGFGVVEAIHSVGRLPAFLNQLSDAQAVDRNRLAWTKLAAGASLFGQEHGGYVWAGVLADRGLLNALKGTTFQGTAIDSSFHIDNGFTDRYLVLAATSLVERDPAALTVNLPKGLRAPCAARRVISGGYSNSALVLRSFDFNGLNTGLANDPRFTAGLVFDGAIHGALTGNHCADLTGQLYLCNGPTPADQGKVITIHPEYDVQQSSPDPDLGFVRGLLVRGEGPNWRIYELAGVSHIATWSRDLKALGIKPEEMPDQNYADARPVFRAMVENLRSWIAKRVVPPPNALLKGEVRDLQFCADCPALPWFMPSAFIPPNFDRDGDYDLNSDGGIRLPHVRTGNFGAPLGLYRGPECNNPNPITDAFACPSWFDENIPPAVVFGGAFYPYSAVADELSTAGLPNPCAYYETHEDYVTAVTHAAKYARDQRWILGDEIDAIIVAAEEKAAQYPGCVPAS